MDSEGLAGVVFQTEKWIEADVPINAQLVDEVAAPITARIPIKITAAELDVARLRNEGRITTDGEGQDGVVDLELSVVEGSQGAVVYRADISLKS